MKSYSKPSFGILIRLGLLLICTSFMFIEKQVKWGGNDFYKGAWRLQNNSNETIKIITDKYFSFATFDIKNKKFIAAGGGLWTADDNTYTETLEYYTADSSKVGESIVFNSQSKGAGWNLTITTPSITLKETWKKIDQASSSPLVGTWRITERLTPEGEKVQMPKAARKTLKFLSDGYFQWAAINPETKEFFGTGGGTYTLKDGKYTEKISFFSRDSSRVGLSLTFDYKVDQNKWNHTGKSSTGNKVDEVWSRED